MLTGLSPEMRRRLRKRRRLLKEKALAREASALDPRKEKDFKLD